MAEEHGGGDGLAVSLFSNCGAGDSGYARAGFSFQVMAELDERRLAVAIRNHSGATPIPGDLRATWPQVVNVYRSRAGDLRPALLAACPPCQGMSSAQSRRGRSEDPDAGSRDIRNLLVEVIASATKALRPRVVVVENVLAFLTRKVRHPTTGAPVSAALWLIEALAEEYTPFPFACDLADYGVPQTRKRAFLTFIHRSERGLATLANRNRAPYPRPTHAVDYGGRPVTLREALAQLGAGPLDARTPEGAGDGLHSVPVWDDARYALVAAIPPDTGSGAWQNNACLTCGPVAAASEDTTCQRCGGPLARPVIRDGNGWRFIRGFRASSYTRMRADAPAATITTASGSVGSDKTLHPWENRVLSPAECQHVQTFPDGFDWGDALARLGPTNVRAMIGEAVPPMFTSMHGEVLRGLLDGVPRRAAIVASDGRVRRAALRLRAERDHANRAGVSC